MRRAPVFLVLAGILAFALFLAAQMAVEPAAARPEFGGNCTTCHPNGPPKQATESTAKPAAQSAAPKASQPAKPAQPATATQPAKAAAPAPTAVDVKLDIVGKVSTVKGLEQGGKVLVPLRDVAQALGAQVQAWEAKTGKAAVAYRGQVVSLEGGQIIGGKGYVEAGALAAVLGLSYDAKSRTIALSKVQIITEQWSTSAHARAVLESDAAKRDTCVYRHNGEAFAKATRKAADVNVQSPQGQTCNACHTGNGMTIRDSGVAKLDTGWTVTGAGKGALCMTCHNLRRSPAERTNPRAPHPPTQTNVLMSEGGFLPEGMPVISSPHLANPDTCVSCHVVRENGVVRHTFELSDADAQATCGKCHPGLSTLNRTALADYDGDKVVEGIQDEVHGLLELVKDAINKAIDPAGGSFADERGSFVFRNAKGEAVKVSDNIWKAAWNWQVVEDDGSHGVHNPAYAVRLLQQAYKFVTGKDVPNAAIR